MNFKHTFKAAILTVLMTTGLCGSLLQAQSLYVLKSNASQDVYANASIKRLSFDDGDLIIAKADGSVEQVALSEISRMSFKDYTSTPIGLEDVQSSSEQNLQCYPNPTDGQLNIEMLSSDGDVSIEVLTTAGQLVVSESQYYTDSLVVLNVSGLEAGIYILRVRNKQGVQTTTFIKQ